MIGFVTTKKHISTVLLIMLLSVVLLVAVLWKTHDANAEEVVAQSAETVAPDRIGFIESLGYTVDRSVAEETKEITVPDTFSGLYAKYQQIQLEAGYDLTKYSGEKVVIYTYKLVYEGRNDVYAHLILHDGAIIGGDIAALSVSDGFIYALTTRKN